jgi:hypothetical protein
MLIKFTTEDVLLDRLRRALGRVTESDCNAGTSPDFRAEAHADLREIADDARARGVDLNELYLLIVIQDEGRADYEAL